MRQTLEILNVKGLRVEISTEDTEIKSFEPLDKEPFHYIALIRNKGMPTWYSTYTYPMTDKQLLINNLISNWSTYDEARIIKVRLPIV